MPFSHSLCGDLTYTSQFNDAVIGATSTPLAYTMSANEFSIYSEDLGLLGQNIVKVQAFLTQYTAVESSVLETTIELVDPCLDPFTLDVPVQTAPADYYYTEDSPSLVFATELFPVTPVICTVTYSCAILTAGLPDICDVQNGLTDGAFVTETGHFTFKSNDIVNYLPGTYQMEITGDSGAKQGKFTIDLVLVNPCFTVDLDMQANPFVD